MRKKPSISVVCAIALHLLAVASPVRAEPFRVLGFHYTLGAGRKDFYKAQFKRVKEHEYNTLVLMLSTGNGMVCNLKMGAGCEKAYTTAEVMELIAHARSLGLTVIPEVKMFGKQHKTLGRAFIKAHPGICNQFDDIKSPVYDPFYKLPDGRGIHEAIVYPLMDDSKKTLLLSGRRTHIGMMRDATIAKRDGVTALNCGGKGGVSIPPLGESLAPLANGVTFEVVFMVTQKPDDKCRMLFSFGAYSQGMRTYINKDLTLQGQVAQPGLAPVHVETKKPIAMNQWHSIRFTYDKTARRATIRVNNEPAVFAPVPRPIVLPRNIHLGIGLEVLEVRRMWRQFPGRIKTFRVLTP